MARLPPATFSYNPLTPLARAHLGISSRNAVEQEAKFQEAVFEMPWVRHYNRRVKDLMRHRGLSKEEASAQAKEYVLESIRRNARSQLARKREEMIEEHELRASMDQHVAERSTKKARTAEEAELPDQLRTRSAPKEGELMDANDMMIARADGSLLPSYRYIRYEAQKRGDLAGFNARNEPLDVTQPGHAEALERRMNVFTRWRDPISLFHPSLESGDLPMDEM